MQLNNNLIEGRRSVHRLLLAIILLNDRNNLFYLNSWAKKKTNSLAAKKYAMIYIFIYYDSCEFTSGKA